MSDKDDAFESTYTFLRELPPVGALVHYHPVIGEPHNGKTYIVRAVEWRGQQGCVWLKGKAGFVALEALTLVPSETVELLGNGIADNTAAAQAAIDAGQPIKGAPEETMTRAREAFQAGLAAGQVIKEREDRIAELERRLQEVMEDCERLTAERDANWQQAEALRYAVNDIVGILQDASEANVAKKILELVRKITKELKLREDWHLTEDDKKTPEHCDNYIWRLSAPTPLRFWLLINRLPALERIMAREAGCDPQCYATYKDGDMHRIVRLTMASRMGDIGISYDLRRSMGYDKRVMVASLTDFRLKP